MKDTPSKKQLREFGFLLGLGFPIFLGWLLPALKGHPFSAWTLWIGIPGLLLGLVSPLHLAWPYRAWMGLGHALGWVNSHLILGLVFILVLQPIAFVMRLFGHDPLRRKRSSVTKTYRELRQNNQTDLKRIF